MSDSAKQLRTIDVEPDEHMLIKPGELIDIVELSPLTLQDRPTCAKQPNARRCGCYETAWHARAAEGHPGRGRGRAGFRGRAGRGGLPRCRRLIGGPIA